MVDRTALLSDLKTVLRDLEADLLARSEEMPEIKATLEREYQRARAAERTAQSYVEWRADAVTQTAAAWVLSCVFVRFLEDNGLIDPPKIAGPGERLRRARDEHELYFRAHPRETDRDYLLHVFDELANVSGTTELFGEHNSIRQLPNWLSGDAAGELLTFFQRIDANTGALGHDFTDSEWDTRFLGDLYQDVSESARKKYALLQTPEFVESFILDRTLEPALDAFGLSAGPDALRLLDPTCGSGHFLLGAFQRILHRWLSREPGTAARELVQRTLDAVCGVDINPFAVAIARFRLLVAALQASGINTLRDAPGYRINVVAGDSLLHGRRFDELPLQGESVDLSRVGGIDHVYHAEDLVELNRILGRQYHVVVGNPPYITVKDKALNQAYRGRYSTCHRQYSLGVPFTQRFFDLAIYGQGTAPAGYVGMITANSFMKREFGKKLIEAFFPGVDLTHVIDTSGTYIPGHGTPTVILFGQNRLPLSQEVRAVLGIRGEPATPEKAAEGKVWQSIVGLLDQNESQNEFVSVTNVSRETFGRHPWSMGGGGATELKRLLETASTTSLGKLVESIGRTTVVGEDECWIFDHNSPRRLRVFNHCLEFGVGESIRDWSPFGLPIVIYPYKDIGGTPISSDSHLVSHYLWHFRTLLSQRTVFGKSLRDQGRPWFEHLEHYVSKLRTPLSIAFAFVATHNHFVLDRGGKVFKQSAPIIKLPSDATEEDHLALLGLLNSSTACFWMKQVFQDKGNGGIGGGIGDELWERRYEHSSTGLSSFPVSSHKPIKLPKFFNSLAEQYKQTLPDILVKSYVISADIIASAKLSSKRILHRMITMQEELDWQCYQLYGLSSDSLQYQREPPPIKLGQRAFEIVMARKMAVGELETAWFDRHSSTPMTELPAEWPEDYRQLVERRLALIETDRNIGLIEQPEYKRRWNTEPWESQLARALHNWLLDRLERYFDIDGRMNDAGTPTATIDIALVSTARLADIARQDEDFMQVGALYRDDPAFNIDWLVTELVESESVPLLPILRYKASGLSKRAAWEQTWDLQRLEDKLMEDKLLDLSSWYLDEDKRSAIADWQQTATSPLHTKNQKLKTKNQELSTLLAIPVPPKYKSSDFQNNTYWRLRGKLDVPKERWVRFPHSEGNDGALVIAWAGYDHLQLAKAISAYYVDIQEHLGGSDDPRLVPLLGGLIDLLPWLKQWHNDIDPEFDMQMGDYFEGFIQEEARQMGKTVGEIKAWKPVKKIGRRRKKSH